MMKPELKIPVRNLVEFILRAGDINTGFMSSSRAVEGTRAHKKLQKMAGDDYRAEVELRYTVEYEKFIIAIEGRADGIFSDGDGVIIDEIKTVTGSMEFVDENYNHLHWAQAKLYAFIYAGQEDLGNIAVQLTYYNIDSEELKFFRKSFRFEELDEFARDILDRYAVWGEFQYNWAEERSASIKELVFPFPAYRKGQRELAVAAYRTIAEKKKLFVQAPTGIGKTISTVFPSVKAIGEGLGEKLFYLTARTVTRQVAEEAFVRMRGRGLKFKTITLTAKDKLCFKTETLCKPEECEFARGHFDRVNQAILDMLLNEDALTRDVVSAYAQKYCVCPFELSLDAALWTDCVICDYNYAFDPQVYLKRFFDRKGNYIFLIDEAHNLVDRAREMFSAELSKRAFMDLRKDIKGISSKLYKTLGLVNKYFIGLRKNCENQPVFISSEGPEDLYKLLRQFSEECEEVIFKNGEIELQEGLLELYFQCLSFIKIGELYDERYVTYITCEVKDIRLKLFCLDPSFLLKEALKRSKSTVLFSATLTPLEYFREILGGLEDDYIMRLGSPFDREKLCLMIAADVSTKYMDRKNSYLRIVEYIKAVTLQKTGNYFVFFPSFEYMREVSDLYKEMFPEDRIIIQQGAMNEEERESFLDSFKSGCNTTLIGFAVMGGIFSEGVDLAGDRLSGALIVGVGLPQLNPERDIIMSYFKKKNGLGYEYAYMYPGMNKVLQAAGRVIRTEEDRGIVMLIDGRFLTGRYLDLFPKEWSSYIKVWTPFETKRKLSGFWG